MSDNHANSSCVMLGALHARPCWGSKLPVLTTDLELGLRGILGSSRQIAHGQLLFVLNYLRSNNPLIKHLFRLHQLFTRESQKIVHSSIHAILSPVSTLDCLKKSTIQRFPSSCDEICVFPTEILQFFCKTRFLRMAVLRSQKHSESKKEAAQLNCA